MTEEEDKTFSSRSGWSSSSWRARTCLREVGVLGWGDATAKQAVRGWSLCPSRKLTRQTTEVLAALTNSCQGVVKVLDIGVKAVSVVAPLLKELPDIIVGTPGCPSQHLKEGNLNLTTSLAMLINDEADLIFSFCFESDL